MKKFIFLILMTGSAISFGITKGLEESSEWRYDDYFDEMTDIKTHRAWLWAKEKIPFNKEGDLEYDKIFRFNSKGLIWNSKK